MEQEYDIDQAIKLLSPKLKEIENLREWCNKNNVFYTYALNIKNRNNKKVSVSTISKILNIFGIKHKVEKKIIFKIK